jgi:hypothetical protein
VLAKPPLHGRDGLVLVLFLPLQQVQQLRTSQRGEVAAEVLGGIGADEPGGGVAVAGAPGVFDGEAGLADATEAGDGGALGDGGRAAAGQGVELLLAAGEEVAEARVGEVVDWWITGEEDCDLL